ncbi:MAG: GerMN domain-containing protein [Gracilibacteraceae bacterium]|nr:GerMN domain-containing protein [Gracilibacteraceae bacterium]
MSVHLSKGLLVLAVLVMMVSMAGCGILEELVGQDPVAAGLSQLLDFFTQSEAVSSQGVLEQPDGRTQSVKLYYANAEGSKLVQETREIPHTLSLGRETLRQWLLGPEEKSSLQRTVGAATALKDIDIKDGVAKIDLSKGFLELNGPINAQMALYSLVNTMCQFSTVNQVVLLIDGVPISSYYGISTANLQWRSDLIDLTAESAVVSNDGFRVDTDLEGSPDSGSDSAGDLSPSSINIFY